MVFLKLRIPKGSWKAKLGRMDWMYALQIYITQIPVINLVYQAGMSSSWAVRVLAVLH